VERGSECMGPSAPPISAPPHAMRHVKCNAVASLYIKLSGRLLILCGGVGGVGGMREEVTRGRASQVNPLPSLHPMHP
jgi:hypothetical protein